MRFIVLTVFSVLCVLTPAARAEDTPPPASSAVTQTSPATPSPLPQPAAEAGDKATARKEEEDETASMLARIKAYATGKNTLANNIASLDKKVAALTAQLKERDDRIASLMAENDKMRADLASFGAWLEANGHTTVQEATADPGNAFQKAVGTGVATEVRKIGVATATVKTKPASGEAAPDALREAFRAETDPAKKSALFQQIKRADEAARSRSN